MVYLLQYLRNKKLLNIRINRLSDKLDFRKLRLFKILKKIGEVSYKLNLPDNIKLRTAVFYISLLKKVLVDKEIGEIIINKIIV
jgi:transcription initiation factor TFIIIB Brf1 subunit/transcription initiation factor TFIIB